MGVVKDSPCWFLVSIMWRVKCFEWYAVRMCKLFKFNEFGSFNTVICLISSTMNGCFVLHFFLFIFKISFLYAFKCKSLLSTLILPNYFDFNVRNILVACDAFFELYPTHTFIQSKFQFQIISKQKQKLLLIHLH